jgi:hypothetical protein
MSKSTRILTTLKWGLVDYFTFHTHNSYLTALDVGDTAMLAWVTKSMGNCARRELFWSH